MSQNNGVLPKPLSKSPFVIEQWMIEPALNCVTRDGHTTHLEPKAMQLLLLLAEHAGEVLPRDMILNSVWSDSFVSDQVLTNAVWQIRHAFGNNGRDLIQTIPKSGYRLNAPPEPPAPQLQLVHDRDALPPAYEHPSREPPEGPKTDSGHPGFWRRRATLIGIAAIATAVALLFPQMRRTITSLIGRPPATIAVLPFENPGGDLQQGLSADSFTEELIQVMTTHNSKKLGVIAWSAVEPYKNSSKPLNQIGKELKVEYILEGRMWQQGTLIHVTVELVEVASQQQLWSTNYEHSADDLEILKLGIANQVGGAAQRKFSPAK